MKTCKACQATKPFSEFFPDNRGYGDGYRSKCRHCIHTRWSKTDHRTKEWRQNQRRRLHLAPSNYRTEDQVRVAAIARTEKRKDEALYRAINRSFQRSLNPGIGTLQWYAIATSEQISAYRKRVADKARAAYNPAKAIAKVKAWKAANPGKLHAQRVVRRLRLDAYDDGTLTNDVVEALYRSATHCPYCEKPIKRKTLEHMTPVSRGGHHSITNVVIACLRCNISKAALMPLEFMWSRLLPAMGGPQD